MQEKFPFGGSERDRAEMDFALDFLLVSALCAAVIAKHHHRMTHYSNIMHEEIRVVVREQKKNGEID